MFLLFQNWGSYGNPAEFNVLSLMDLLLHCCLVVGFLVVFWGFFVVLLLFGMFLFGFVYN